MFLSDTDRPVVIAVAGPNGAGKSTLATLLLRDFLCIREYVNADTIASGLSAFNSQSVALESGRIALNRLNFLISQRMSFAFETTLAARFYAAKIKELCRHGYHFYLFYLWLRNAEIAVERVRERVRMGGHDVPEKIIRQRYARGIKNFHHLYVPLATSWGIYDNSTAEGLKLIAAGSKNSSVKIYETELWTDILSLG